MYPRRGSSSEEETSIDRNRAAIFHDYFSIKGGGERVALSIANDLGYHLYYGYLTSSTYSLQAFPDNSHSLNLHPLVQRRGLRPLTLSYLFRRARRIASQYELRIYSGVAAPFAAPPLGSSGLNVFYCHTPPRFLYDQKAHFLNLLPNPLRWIAPWILRRFEKGYIDAINNMDIIIANSENTKIRLREYIGVDSRVVYPPVDTERFKWQGQGDYYVSTARLSPLKRVDRIIDAFSAMPEKKLIVVSGGEELDRLRSRAKNFSNIDVLGWVTESALEDIVGNAIATIYIPKDEDFGISPLESMAAGKPVIGVAEGGLRETIIDGETGILLPSSPTSRAIVEAVRSLNSTRALQMRRACEQQAQRFQREKFVEAMSGIIQGLQPKLRRAPSGIHVPD
ncbi:glycosyltransferase [Nitratireductor basaltis]|uniref:Glycosyltransferase n=1 Tax=Nitratireductor basaltis TaxID=472175 RepID=A0A084UD05_9HYPH|nr:glycosyltransferase [Nitratireductor basaltis]KFB10841.1 Glycosyltransferase [Nitratireductor basaltis]